MQISHHQASLKDLIDPIIDTVNDQEIRSAALRIARRMDSIPIFAKTTFSADFNVIRTKEQFDNALKRLSEWATENRVQIA